MMVKRRLTDYGKGLCASFRTCRTPDPGAPDAKPRIISDNGSQFVSRDFKEMVRISGMTHVRTSPYHPQRHGKAERAIGTTKRECIRPS